MYNCLNKPNKNVCELFNWPTKTAGNQVLVLSRMRVLTPRSKHACSPCKNRRHLGLTRERGLYHTVSIQVWHISLNCTMHFLNRLKNTGAPLSRARRENHANIPTWATNSKASRLVTSCRALTPHLYSYVAVSPETTFSRSKYLNNTPQFKNNDRYFPKRGWGGARVRS